MKEIIDHRMVRSDISLGGTTGPFVLEAMGTYGFAARLTGLEGGTAEICGLYEKETLFRVVYPNSMEASYDYGGNLQRFAMNVARVFADMPSEVVDQMDLSVTVAIKHMIEAESDLTVEVDLKDGLALGDKSGWLQVVAGKNLKKTDGGIGGREIWPEAEPTKRAIAVNDSEGALIGIIYIVTGLVGDKLIIGAGDQNLYFVMQFRRLIDPEKLQIAKKPEGAKAFLATLTE